MKKISKLITFCFLLITASLFGQEKFSAEVLNNVKKYGSAVEEAFAIIETSNFHTDTINRVILKNGLRSSKCINPESWNTIKDDVEVVSISVVFSKYPIRKNGYSMNHKLLFNRLKNLFQIDPLLNDSLINWKIILLTNCKNDVQVDSLFHGIIIEYKNEEGVIEFSNSSKLNISSANTDLLKKIESLYDLPKEVKKKLDSSDPFKKSQILIDYFEKLLEDTISTEITPILLENHIQSIIQFIETYSNYGDNIVTTVFNRNKHWENALVVADWTGSMYQYGAQALLWHSLNFNKSGLSYFALFNDGGLKSNESKVIGETGGVYFEKANNIDNIFNLYQLVMLKGGGGDGPENDIEGILKGLEKYPMSSELILIADNNSCVRDMELIKDIHKPVRIIICGYNRKLGINPQYIYLAKETGGSIHTMESDIYNIQVELDNKGKVISLQNYDFKIGKSHCYDIKSIFPESYYDNLIYTNIDSARMDKNRVVYLDLSFKSLHKIPTAITRFKELSSLNLSNNKISRITRYVYNCEHLDVLDLSHNNISIIPNKLSRLYGLKKMDLSYNSINLIKSLPRLNSLIHLDLSDNNFSNLPNLVGFKNIELLYLNNNKLTQLPASIGRLRKLKELSVKGNSISVITTQIGYLRKLEYLDLSDNNLSELPKQIRRLRKLKTLRLSGNNFTTDYIDYLKKILPNTSIENQ